MYIKSTHLPILDGKLSAPPALALALGSIASHPAGGMGLPDNAVSGTCPGTSLSYIYGVPSAAACCLARVFSVSIALLFASAKSPVGLTRTGPFTANQALARFAYSMRDAFSASLKSSVSRKICSGFSHLHSSFFRGCFSLNIRPSSLIRSMASVWSWYS